MKGPAPCCAVPLTTPPEAVSAVIWLAPPPAAVPADQLRPSGELQVTARGAAAGPARPAATNPWPAALSARTLPRPPGEDSRVWRQCRPSSAEHTATGTAPDVVTAQPAPTT